MRFRGITMSIAGWLWADLLLGAFVIFAVANTGGPGALAFPAAPTVGAPAIATPATAPAVAGPAAVAPASVATPAPPGIDPRPLDVSIAVDGAALLSGDARAIEVERQRVLDAATRAVGTRRVALVLAYGSHADAATGDRLAQVATAGLTVGPFEGAAIKTFHNLVAGDRGSTVLLSVYFYQ